MTASAPPNQTEIQQASPIDDSLDWLKKSVRSDESGIACLRRCKEVATIVSSINDDPDIVAAAAVFPALADGYLDSTEVGKHFDSRTAGLAADLVALDRIRIPGEIPIDGGLGGDQAEALRKMLLAVVADVRLLLVRLADQLCLLRSLKKAPIAVRRQAALETRLVFAPLANRLGIWQLKWELEDLAFRFLEQDAYQRIASDLRERRSDRERYINDVKAVLQSELNSNGIAATISGRPKHIYSIWKKMQRKQLAFEQVLDIRAVRVQANNVADCYAALGIVHGLWPYIRGEFDDYIATPKENNYRSLHTAVIGPESKPLEIQIRTEEMHRHAELGVAAHWQYKEASRRDTAFQQKIVWLRKLLEPDDDSESGGDFLSRVQSEIFEDRIYVISPKGDVVDLPQGATPLDFAYHVHTDVGHHCRGAKVNGRMVPLTHALSNGDQVEILTAKNTKPSRDWLAPQLGYLASSRGRAKVRAWFSRLDNEQHRRQGKLQLEKEMQRLGVKDWSHEKLARLMRYGSPEMLYTALGSGEITTSSIAGAIQRAEHRESVPTLKARPPSQGASGRGAISVEGVGDLMTAFARCCRPVPPERISGYVTQGRGVTIHREDCGNLVRLKERSSERVLKVSWHGGDTERYPARVRVHAYDRPGLVRDITALLSDENVRISGLDTRTDKIRNTAELRMELEVSGLNELSRLLHRLNMLPNVVSAERET